MNKKILIFDLDDTLLDFKAGEIKGLKKVFTRFAQADLNYHEWLTTYHNVNQLVWKKIEQGMAAKPLLDTRFSDTFSAFGQRIDGKEAEAYYRLQLDQNDAMIPGAKALIHTLKEAGYLLIAGTNGKTSTQYQRLAATTLDRYFDHIVISDEIGIAKPHPDFFAHIFKLLPEYERSAYVMIGDSLRSDILGAQQAMIDSIWFNPTHAENHSAIMPTFTVSTLAELATLLA